MEDLRDGGAVTVMYRCLSRSFSVGSQLSAAAASTIHEESCSDLTVDANNSRSDYLPMSRISVVREDSNGPVVGPPPAAQGISETSPLLSARSDVSPKPGSVSQSSALSSRASDSAMVVPSSMSASYRNARDESGYLLFRPSDGGSLERLGPPPQIPTSAADYIIPRLPPKQHVSSGQRANSLLLGCRPHVAARRRGSADSWGVASSGPAVPPRENRDSASAGISSRPTPERRGPRKPNLTVDAVASANSVYTGERLTIKYIQLCSHHYLLHRTLLFSRCVFITLLLFSVNGFSLNILFIWPKNV